MFSPRCIPPFSMLLLPKFSVFAHSFRLFLTINKTLACGASHTAMPSTQNKAHMIVLSTASAHTPNFLPSFCFFITFFLFICAPHSFFVIVCILSFSAFIFRLFFILYIFVPFFFFYFFSFTRAAYILCHECLSVLISVHAFVYRAWKEMKQKMKHKWKRKRWGYRLVQLSRGWSEGHVSLCAHLRVWETPSHICCTTCMCSYAMPWAERREHTHCREDTHERKP